MIYQRQKSRHVKSSSNPKTNVGRRENKIINHFELPEENSMEMTITFNLSRLISFKFPLIHKFQPRVTENIWSVKEETNGGFLILYFGRLTSFIHTRHT